MEYISILRKCGNHPLHQLFIQLGDNFTFMSTKLITLLHIMRAIVREASKHSIHPDTIECIQLSSSTEQAYLTISIDERTRTEGQKRLAWELISHALEETSPCKHYDTQSESLRNSIELMHVQKQVPYHLRTIDFDTLVGFNNQHSLEVRYHIAKSISTFLCSITSSIWPRTHPIYYNMNNI